jgi:hypothetical protein
VYARQETGLAVNHAAPRPRQKVRGEGREGLGREGGGGRASATGGAAGCCVRRDGGARPGAPPSTARRLHSPTRGEQRPIAGGAMHSGTHSAMTARRDAARQAAPLPLPCRPWLGAGARSRPSLQLGNGGGRSAPVSDPARLVQPPEAARPGRAARASRRGGFRPPCRVGIERSAPPRVAVSQTRHQFLRPIKAPRRDWCSGISLAALEGVF